MTEALLALDVGSQSVRALWLDRDGQRVLSQTPLPLPVTPDGTLTSLAPDQLWQALASCVEDCLEQAPRRRLAALAVTTQRATSVALDDCGQTLTPLLRWNDQLRATDIPALPWHWRCLLRLGGASELIANLQRHSPANWLVCEQPETAARVVHWLQLSGWINFQLTGLAHDCSAAQVGYLPFNYRHQRWRHQGHFLWPALAIPRTTLPRLFPPGTVLGLLQSSAANQLGLPRGLPVVACAADKACEVLGSGGHTDSRAVLSLGTAASAIRYQPHWRTVQRYQPPWPAATGRGYQMEIQLPRGFWLVRLLQQLDSTVMETVDVPEAWLRPGEAPVNGDELARELDRQSLAHWPGVLDQHRRQHGAAGTYQALVDGLLRDLVAALDWLDHRAGEVSERVLVVGGASRSDALVQHLADLLGRPVQVSAEAECGALGAAMTTAVAVGWQGYFNQAVEAWVPPCQEIHPTAADQGRNHRGQPSRPPHPLAPNGAE